jgi:exonuclease VII small subunit
MVLIINEAYSTLESPWLNRRIEKSVLSPSHAKIRVTEQNSQKKLQEHVNRLETLNSDLEQVAHLFKPPLSSFQQTLQTRESAEDEVLFQELSLSICPPVIAG